MAFRQWLVLLARIATCVVIFIDTLLAITAGPFPEPGRGYIVCAKLGPVIAGQRLNSCQRAYAALAISPRFQFPGATWHVPPSVVLFETDSVDSRNFFTLNCPTRNGVFHPF